MLRKISLSLIALWFLLFLAVPVWADQSPTVTQPTTINSNSNTDESGPFSSFATDNNGIQPITPIDLDSAGNKAVSFGNKSFQFFLKGSIPLFILSIGGSILLLLLGIFFGKKAIAAGIIGIIISLLVFALFPYLPQIALTAKNAAGSFLTP